MGTFTIPLKEVIEIQEAKDRDYALGLSEYPIFDESYRKDLNQKIIDHYWNMEIGQETIDLFTFAMRRKMNEIMPMYNQLYKSQLLEIDPLLTFSSSSSSRSNGRSEANTNGTSVGTNVTDSDGKSQAIASDAPQTRLSPEGESYASAIQDSTSNNTATSKSDEQSSAVQRGSQEDIVESETSGFSASQAVLLQQFRDTFLNVDLQIIAELADLFMLIWDNGDEYTDPRTIPYFWRLY